MTTIKRYFSDKVQEESVNDASAQSIALSGILQAITVIENVEFLRLVVIETATHLKDDPDIETAVENDLIAIIASTPTDNIATVRTNIEKIHGYLDDGEFIYGITLRDALTGAIDIIMVEDDAGEHTLGEIIELLYSLILSGNLSTVGLGKTLKTLLGIIAIDTEYTKEIYVKTLTSIVTLIETYDVYNKTQAVSVILELFNLLKVTTIPVNIYREAVTAVLTTLQTLETSTDEATLRTALVDLLPMTTAVINIIGKTDVSFKEANG